jgi:hypothetical protein
MEGIYFFIQTEKGKFLILTGKNKLESCRIFLRIMNMKKITGRAGKWLLTMIIPFMIISCENSDGPLAPYAGSPALSKITVEEGTFTPKITWIGGYASVVGINRGANAALDTSLVWLVYRQGNNLKYPIKYGTIPEGAQDLTSTYGGISEPELTEDRNYTFWVMKEEVWSKISNSTNKIIVIDSSLQDVSAVGDTLKVPALLHTALNKNFDNYVNIFNITTRGPLADLNVVETDTSNSVFISWVIKQAGYTDSTVAVVGLVEGGQYDIGKVLWELYSEDLSTGQPVYGKHNVIASPIHPVEERPGTRTFFSFPLNGLERGKGYYVWIAGKDWNGVDRLRVTQHYAYLTFETR